jgi:acetyl esterase
VPAQVGEVKVRIAKPVAAPDVLPVILYVHGGGWILGNAGTHDRLVRELAAGVPAGSHRADSTTIRNSAARRLSACRNGAAARWGRSAKFVPSHQQQPCRPQDR